ncbi:MAG TPA: RimK family alpha-L-glutamate ligase [Gemmatimonadaceae bacterium]|jgi:RimK family alpha-L-glutamate ligase
MPPCCGNHSSGEPAPNVHIPILSARTGWHTDELLRALAARGHTGTVVPYESLVARIAPRTTTGSLSADSQQMLSAPAVLARIIPNGSLEQIIYRVDALHWLEERGVRVMNSPRAIERCVDKFYTSALLHEAGLDTPETVVCERIDDAMAAVREMGDVIVKPLFGSMGHGMVRVSDPETAFRVFRALELARTVFYLQRVVEHAGCDVRAFVVGNRVIAAIERRARDGGWRTNISLGGEARAIDLPSAWSELALTAARAVGADYAGVDLLPASDGTIHVLEVNGIPGWSGAQKATSVDIAGAIVDHLIGTVCD